MTTRRMTFFDQASPALVEILNRLDRSEKPTDIDHDIYEFGSVRYHVQALSSDPQIVYLSISMPPLSPEPSLFSGLPECTLQVIKRMCHAFAETLEHPRAGFLLTLRLNLAKISYRKEDRIKAIVEISSLQAVVMALQLKEMLWNVGSQDMNCRMYKPIKLSCHPQEPFFVIRLVLNDPVEFRRKAVLNKQSKLQPGKITAIFPMRFKEGSDVLFATSFFQELMDVGYSATCTKAPHCTWSPIPPPELRGEALQCLTTNGGFVSLDILPQHVKGARAEKAIWILLNFDAFVKYHVKCAKGFIQRKLRQRMESLAEVLQNARVGGNGNTQKVQSCKYVNKLKRFSKSTALKQRWKALISNRIKRIHLRIRIKGLDGFRRRCFKIIPKFNYTSTKYTKLD